MKKYIIHTFVALMLILSVNTPAHAATIAELQTLLNQLQVQLNALSSGPMSMSIKFVPNTENVVGIWDVFAPGMGRNNTWGADWRWDITFQNKGVQTRTIKKITVLHESTGEGWSTDRVRMYDHMNGYPLLVQGYNSKYVSDLDLAITPGKNITLQLYGQSESSAYTEATVKVYLTDGTSVAVRVSPNTPSIVII